MPNEPIAAVFDRLRAWACLPKYSLERRLDIFLTPFLGPFLSATMDAPVTLIAPEFPIKHEKSNQSVNVDYLLRRDGRDPAWLFLELKTDPRSLKDAQLARYLRAQSSGMSKFLSDAAAIGRATLQVHRPKYQSLLRMVSDSGPSMDPIELVYFSPTRPSCNVFVGSASKSSYLGGRKATRTSGRRL